MRKETNVYYVITNIDDTVTGRILGEKWANVTNSPWENFSPPNIVDLAYHVFHSWKIL